MEAALCSMHPMRKRTGHMNHEHENEHVVELLASRLDGAPGWDAPAEFHFRESLMTQYRLSSALELQGALDSLTELMVVGTGALTRPAHAHNTHASCRTPHRAPSVFRVVCSSRSVPSPPPPWSWFKGTFPPVNALSPCLVVFNSVLYYALHFTPLDCRGV